MSYFPNPSELFYFSTKIPDGTLPLVERINWALIVGQRTGRTSFTVDTVNKYTKKETDDKGVEWVMAKLREAGWQSELEMVGPTRLLTVIGYTGDVVQIKFDNSPDEWFGLGPAGASEELKLALRKAANENRSIKEMIIHPQNEVVFPATPPISPEEALEAAIKRMKNQQKETNNG